MNDSAGAANIRAHHLRQLVESQLDSGELLVASCQFDLDDELRFTMGLMALTTKRLFSVRDTRAENSGLSVDQWQLSDIAELDLHDRGGLATLEARSDSARLAVWYLTVGQAVEAKRLADDFERLKTGGLTTGTALEAEIEIPEAEEPEPAASAIALLRLLRFAKKRASILVLGIILTLATTIAGLVAPVLTAPLIDDVLEPYKFKVDTVRSLELDEREAAIRLADLKASERDSFRRVPWLLAGMAGAAMAAWLLGWGQGWVLARLSERISVDLRNTMYNHLLPLSLEFYSAKRTGDLVARISSDTDRICNFLSDSLTDFVTDVLMIVFTVVVLFWMDPWLALATICTFPVIGLLTLKLRDRLTHGFLHGSRAWADMTSILSDTIPGIRVVKAFAQERREIERFRAANRRIMEANDRVNAVWTFFWPVVAFLNQAGVLVVLAAGAWGAFEQRISVGILTSALTLVSRFYARLESMSRMATNTQRAAASAQRIFEILDRVSTVPEPARPVPPHNLQGRIELKAVGFRFGNRQVIDNVSLSIRPGEMIGLVGTTGAGKSTLVNLVCRFYDVAAGVIQVDGTDVRSFPVSEYRRHIGIVLQDPFLFYGTIADNIAYGKPHSTREEIIAAARAARAHEFILQLPDGYDSIVGERGQTLSGGERQRISIARAILIDPRILILDEATSSVDTQTERKIQEALDNLVRGRTTIAIAHRLSTLRKADRLVVLERGRIVEVGNHDTLLSTNGAYARLYHAQMQHSGDLGSPASEPIVVPAVERYDENDTDKE